MLLIDVRGTEIVVEEEVEGEEDILKIEETSDVNEDHQRLKMENMS
jgi:hypothetical protein